MSSAASSSSARRVKVPSGRARDANMEFRVVRSETRPTGDQIELVRPIAHDTLTTEAIVRKLAQEYGYKTQTLTATKSDLNTLNRAFPRMSSSLINSYEGSTLHSDLNQDLIGDRYLAELIRKQNEDNKQKSILDKWGHLLYEGEDERTYLSAAEMPIKDLTGLKPVVYNNKTYKSTASTKTTTATATSSSSRQFYY